MTRTLLLLLGFVLLLSPVWVLVLAALWTLRKDGQKEPPLSGCGLGIVVTLLIAACWLALPEVSYRLRRPLAELEIGSSRDELMSRAGNPQESLSEVETLNTFLKERGLRCAAVAPRLTSRYGTLERIAEPQGSFRDLRGEMVIYSGFSFILVRMEEDRVAGIWECTS